MGILAIDDDGHTLAILQRALGQQGFAVSAAGTGEEALARCAVRQLPQRLFQYSGLAYPVHHITGQRGQSAWTISQAWIV